MVINTKQEICKLDTEMFLEGKLCQTHTITPHDPSNQYLLSRYCHALELDWVSIVDLRILLGQQKRTVNASSSYYTTAASNEASLQNSCKYAQQRYNANNRST